MRDYSPEATWWKEWGARSENMLALPRQERDSRYEVLKSLYGGGKDGVRIANMLFREGYTTAEEIESLSDDDLQDIPNLGAKSFAIIRAASSSSPRTPLVLAIAAPNPEDTDADRQETHVIIDTRVRVGQNIYGCKTYVPRGEFFTTDDTGRAWAIEKITTDVVNRVRQELNKEK